MDFNIIVLLISFAVSVIVGAITIPQLKRLKVGQIERDDGPQSHLKKQGTPTMWGIIILISITIVIGIVSFFYYKSGEFVIAKRLIALLIVMLLNHKKIN